MRILRYEVPVDDLPHALLLFGDPLHVNAPSERMVEFWAWAPVHQQQMEPRPPRSFIVIGTAQPGPAGDAKYWGTVIPAGRGVVWHLIELVHE